MYEFFHIHVNQPIFHFLHVHQEDAPLLDCLLANSLVTRIGFGALYSNVHWTNDGRRIKKHTPVVILRWPICYLPQTSMHFCLHPQEPCLLCSACVLRVCTGVPTRVDVHCEPPTKLLTCWNQTITAEFHPLGTPQLQRVREERLQ